MPKGTTDFVSIVEARRVGGESAPYRPYPSGFPLFQDDEPNDDEEAKKERDEEKERDKYMAPRAFLERQGHFFLDAGINAETAEKVGLSIRATAERLKPRQRRNRRFSLFINSGGGYTASCYFIGSCINWVRLQCGIPTDTYVTGDAASAASVLAQFGDRRYIDTYSMMMLHDAGYSGGIQGAMDVRRMEDLTVRLNAIRMASARVYARRNTAGHTDPAWWLEHYHSGRDSYLTAEEALVLGLVDEIIDGFVPPVGV